MESPDLHQRLPPKGDELATDESINQRAGQPKVKTNVFYGRLIGLVNTSIILFSAVSNKLIIPCLKNKKLTLKCITNAACECCRCISKIPRATYTITTSPCTYLFIAAGAGLGVYTFHSLVFTSLALEESYRPVDLTLQGTVSSALIGAVVGGVCGGVFALSKKADEHR